MKVMILGAAGQIGRMVTADVLAQTKFDLVLYGRNVTSRLADQQRDRVTLVDGTFEETDKIKANLAGVDAVFIAFVAGSDIMGPLVKTLDDAGVKRFIALSIPDIYQEVTGPFQQWYRDNTGLVWQGDLPKAAAIVENSDLDYVLLRITWLYNRTGNTKVEVTKKGEPFVDAQITREAVAQFVTDLLDGKQDYHRESLGLGEPGTNWRKPSFY
ncbi:NAD-dependent epimerase dehydratase [Lactobacillus selangorensis]|uniref:NAD-dependent epimerase dehydratase n=1 Tax=Lactobacillus selangorensis TaxID=81857 RepID=A0A0R2FR58_9LACO|nr:NAD(P)H-binding protein [Lactobacillus selangorensis]KRN28138.1 NAD-dependent epimerase dehydratase [Lactobacillus selangorensis]KRN30985.1 NAD-dependent epimerase dehydratase [Lactobacillus selangorensis]